MPVPFCGCGTGWSWTPFPCLSRKFTSHNPSQSQNKDSIIYNNNNNNANNNNNSNLQNGDGSSSRRESLQSLPPSPGSPYPIRLIQNRQNHLQFWNEQDGSRRSSSSHHHHHDEWSSHRLEEEEAEEEQQQPLNLSLSMDPKMNLLTSSSIRNWDDIISMSMSTMQNKNTTTTTTATNNDDNKNYYHTDHDDEKEEETKRMDQSRLQLQPQIHEEYPNDPNDPVTTTKNTYDSVASLHHHTRNDSRPNHMTTSTSTSDWSFGDVAEGSPRLHSEMTSTSTSASASSLPSILDVGLMITMEDFHPTSSSSSSTSSSSDAAMDSDAANPTTTTTTTTTRTTHHCQFHLVPDANYPNIHPNVYAPAHLQHMRVLYGGGSGVAVFGGTHPTLGDLVMKHGGSKDLQELFALATITQQLKQRSQNSSIPSRNTESKNNNNNSNTNNTQAITAARNMQERLPSFRAIYISPRHIRSRGKELVGLLKGFVMNPQRKHWGSNSLSTIPSSPSMRKIISHNINHNNNNNININSDNNGNSNNNNNVLLTTPPHPNPKMRRASLYSTVQKTPPKINLGMTMRIYESQVANDPPTFILDDHSNTEQWKLSVILPTGSTMLSTAPSTTSLMSNGGTSQSSRSPPSSSPVATASSAATHAVSSSSLPKSTSTASIGSMGSTTDHSRVVRVHGDAYTNLQHVVMEELLPIMNDRAFKFTLAQKTIGGPNAKTGNQWLYEGRLTGQILQNLMNQMIQVIHDLEALTLPEEDDVAILHHIRQEVLDLEEDNRGFRANHVSKMADTFVGNAIQKNFHPTKGRQYFLRNICSQFRSNALHLEPSEVTPAWHLGQLLRSGALMSDTFVSSPMESTVLQTQPHFWRNVLRRSVEYRPGMSSKALRRIWTCGLTDAGIHNLFVDETNLYLFDLGEPQLMSLPGFLTKFLFSFFHTLGMQDDQDKGTWVCRFDVVGNNKLVISADTRDLLPKAYDAFEECLDRIITELLDGDDEMRWLLLQYITMQLMSDAAFCLQKWQVKGGGKRCQGKNHQTFQEKWLWRAIWDIYVAFDINTAESWCRFGVVHPHFQDSFETSTMDSTFIPGST